MALYSEFVSTAVLGQVAAAARTKTTATAMKVAFRSTGTALYFQDFCVRVSYFWRCVTGGTQLLPAV